MKPRAEINEVKLSALPPKTVPSFSAIGRNLSVLRPNASRSFAASPSVAVSKMEGMANSSPTP
jgi:hypothetical protein